MYPGPESLILRLLEAGTDLATHGAQLTELAAFYNALYTSELGHYKVFLKLAQKGAGKAEADARWQEMLEAEARILAAQPPGPRIHSGLPTATTL